MNEDTNRTFLGCSAHACCYFPRSMRSAIERLDDLVDLESRIPELAPNRHFHQKERAPEFPSSHRLGTLSITISIAQESTFRILIKFD